MSRRACVAHALLRAVSRLLSTPRLRPSRRRHKCRRGTQECVRHKVAWEPFLFDSPLILEPLVEILYLLGRVGREKVLDGYVGRRNQDRFRMSERVKAVLPVVVTDAGGSNASERHRFDK